MMSPGGNNWKPGERIINYLYSTKCLIIFHLYLSTLFPAQVQAVSSYGLRNATAIRTINAHTSQYFNSFSPSVKRNWNSLPNDDRNVDTPGSFKKRLSQSRVAVPNYFYTGARKPQTLHTRLRTKCSSLSYDLFLKNVTDSP